MKFLRDCKTLVIPYVVLFLATILLFASGHPDVAWAVGWLGSAFVVVANLVYIVVWHSLERWPNTHWTERLRRVMTFQR